MRRATSCRAAHGCAEPTVHAVFSPTWGSVWYIGSTYTIMWASTNLPFVEILLLVFNAQGDLAIISTIADNTTNSGSFAWAIPSNTVAATNAYYVTVRPVGASLAQLDGFSRSPEFSVEPTPSGPCPTGYASGTGAWPGCAQCAKGTYV